MIGPLVISLVVVSSTAEKRLVDIGVRDSKLLTPKKRNMLYDAINEMAQNVLIDKIMPEEINNAMHSNISINELEASHFAHLFDKLDGHASRIDRLYLDSPDVIAERFGVRLKMSSSIPMRVRGIVNGKAEGHRTTVIAEHKADARYPVVSAASIMAKVTRDRELKRIERSLRIKLGSGYPSDTVTVEALRGNLANQAMAQHIRSKWRTLNNIRQTRLYNY